jgi:hypothetical protein
MTCSVGAVDAANVGAPRAIDKGQAGSACRGALLRATYRALSSPTVRSNCPSTFVPLAESSGLIRDLGLPRGGHSNSAAGLRSKFNLFAKQSHDEGIVKDVRNIFLN